MEESKIFFSVPNPALVELTKHAKVYTAADKYLIKDPKKLANQKFQNNLRHYYLFACNQFYKGIKDILELIPDSDTTPRDMIFERLRNEKVIYGIKNYPALEDALENIPKLAYWVMRKEEEKFMGINQLFDTRLTWK